MTASAARLARVRDSMAQCGVDALLLSVGPELPWLTGYEAMPLERLTMLVVPREEAATLLVPRLEAPRVRERPDLFDLEPWDETDDPVQRVTALVGGAPTIAIGDRTWARFVVELQGAMPGRTWRRATDVVGALRAVKDPAEVAVLRAAAAAADRVAAQLQAGEIPLVGQTEAQVSAEIGARLLAEGHQRVNFAIVASGDHSASPHHEPGARRIRAGEIVLCDFGGGLADDDGVAYCSDITRCVWTGSSEAPPELRELYAVLSRAHAAAVQAATVGTACSEVDAAARQVITEAGFGDAFIHRTGHGIGIDAHEDPYLVAGNDQPLVAGHAFSVEPGIYLAGTWGLRLEDIVVADGAGPEPLNRADHELVVVDA